MSNPSDIYSQESDYQNELAKELDGTTEVPTPAGRVDILTATQIIEVKDAKQWKFAVGQILVYGEYFPEHQKTLYLIGQVSDDFKEVVENHCTGLDIAVNWINGCVGVSRKPRLPIPLENNLYRWLEALSAEEDRDKANMVIVLLKASRELMDEQRFCLVKGKLRKVSFETDQGK
jgi:hypothetical protein